MKLLDILREVKVNKPFDPKKIIEWFYDDPVYIRYIQDYKSFDELNNDFSFEGEYIPIKKEQFNIIKPLYDKNLIICVGDYMPKEGINIMGFKHIYSTDEDEDDGITILLTKF